LSNGALYGVIIDEGGKFGLHFLRLRSQPELMSRVLRVRTHMQGFDGEQLVEALMAAQSVQARFAALTNGLSALGLDTINYGVFGPSIDDLMDTEIRFMTTMREDWMDYYYDRNLAARDPHVLRIRTGKVTPYILGESLFDRLERPERETVLEGAQAGLVSTLCVPLTGPRDAFSPVGAINLGSSLPEAEFRQIFVEHGATLISLAHLFHTASLNQVWRERAGCEPLSGRERDCLQYVAKGQRHDAIAHTLGLARITVEVHLRGARQKLGARTLGEAVAKALLFGEIAQG